MIDGSASIQAMQALSKAQRITANNVANVNTYGFEPSRVLLQDGPGGEGVGVAAVDKIAATLPTTRQDQPMVDESVRLGRGSSVQELSGKPPSCTDVAREMVSMMRTEGAFSANVAFYRNINDMLGFVMDVKA